MRRIDGIVGNRHDDPALDEQIGVHETAGTLERVVIESSDRKKSRLRVETDAGTDLGIVVDRPELRAGDVLYCDDIGAAVVEFDERVAFVLELPAPDAEVLATVVELGHRIGNQHWNLAVEDGCIYVPVEADRRILESVIEPYLPSGASTRYETVDATLFIDGGGAGHGSGGGDRGHGHGGDHDHSHGGDHDHSHDHVGG